MPKYDKDSLKNSLTIDEVFNYVMELGGDPQMMNGFFIARTICHNPAGMGSHKLYYYDNTHLFCCYTDCGERFDIYELTQKVKKNAGLDWSLSKAINYIASYFGYSPKEFDFEELGETLPDWDILNNYDKINTLENKQIVQLKTFDNDILQFLPQPKIANWEQEGISDKVMKDRGIRYNPISQGIIIPHYNINDQLIGIRERTLIKDQEKYGKYRPAILAGKMYNHPLSFNLYNLNNSAKAISILEKAIVFEGEKSPLLYASIFGEEQDISVACCGSSLITYQVKLLLSLGVKEIIVAFDKQFQEIGDEEFKRWTKKLYDIDKKYSPYVNISFMFDKWNLLSYKSSPIDEGKEKFLTLFERRISI